MNYAETVSYWYLRLNGFFPLNRFVLHREEGERSNHDCDFVAIRPPHVFEAIGGNAEDWDADLFGAYEFVPGNCEDPTTLALIVECKGGRHWSSRDIANSFTTPRLCYAIRRMGVVENARVNELGENLAREKFIRDNGFILGKLVIGESANNEADHPWHSKSIAEAVRFIRRRIEVYADPKRNAWDKFPSDLMQFLIWH